MQPPLTEKSFEQLRFSGSYTKDQILVPSSSLLNLSFRFKTVLGRIPSGPFEDNSFV